LEEEITALNDKNEALSQENQVNKFKNSELVKKIEGQEKQILSLEKQLKTQKDEMQKKLEEEMKEKFDSLQQKMKQKLEAKFNLINNKFVNNLQKEVQEYYDSIPK
jgi:uncharacterized protein YukE